MLKKKIKKNQKQACRWSEHLSAKMFVCVCVCVCGGGWGGACVCAEVLR